jgi:putative ABC transport system substrate-binding protein
MKRRKFIAGLGGAAAWPVGAWAQQRAMPVVGYLSGLSSTALPAYLAAFRQGLEVAGYVEGRNVNIEYRWAESLYDRLPMLAGDLVRRQVKVIAATGGTPSPFAAKAATSTIPVVFLTGGDPIKLGLVSSINRPGGNLTGVSWLSNTIVAKRLELLREMVPTIATIGVLSNPLNPNALPETAELEVAARSLGFQMLVQNASSESGIDAAFTFFVQNHVGAVVIAGDPFFAARHDQIAALAVRHAIPTGHDVRSGVSVGGLMSYGASITDTYRQVGLYTGRILRGENPADMPVQQATKFELVINLKTAKSLGLTIPPKLLFTADEVIE